MRYIVIKEEECSTCKGNYKTPNPAFAKFMGEEHDERDYQPSEFNLCRDCNKGVNRMEIDLQTALKDILARAPSALINDIVQSLGY